MSNIWIFINALFETHGWKLPQKVPNKLYTRIIYLSPIAHLSSVSYTSWTNGHLHRHKYHKILSAQHRHPVWKGNLHLVLKCRAYYTPIRTISELPRFSRFCIRQIIHYHEGGRCDSKCTYDIMQWWIEISCAFYNTVLEYNPVNPEIRIS